MIGVTHTYTLVVRTHPTHGQPFHASCGQTHTGFFMCPFDIASNALVPSAERMDSSATLQATWLLFIIIESSFVRWSVYFTVIRMHVWRSTLRLNITIKYETYYFMELRTTQTASFHALCCTLFLNSTEEKKERAQRQNHALLENWISHLSAFCFFLQTPIVLHLDAKILATESRIHKFSARARAHEQTACHFTKCDSPKYAIILHHSYGRTDCLCIVDRELCTYIFHLSHSISKNAMLAEQEHRQIWNWSDLKFQDSSRDDIRMPTNRKKVSKRTDEIRQIGCMPTVSLNIQRKWVMIPWRLTLMCIWCIWLVWRCMHQHCDEGVMQNRNNLRRIMYAADSAQLELTNRFEHDSFTQTTDTRIRTPQSQCGPTSKPQLNSVFAAEIAESLSCLLNNCFRVVCSLSQHLMQSVCNYFVTWN